MIIRENYTTAYILYYNTFIVLYICVFTNSLFVKIHNIYNVILYCLEKNTNCNSLIITILLYNIEFKKYM